MTHDSTPAYRPKYVYIKMGGVQEMWIAVVTEMDEKEAHEIVEPPPVVLGGSALGTRY